MVGINRLKSVNAEFQLKLLEGHGSILIFILGINYKVDWL